MKPFILSIVLISTSCSLLTKESQIASPPIRPISNFESLSEFGFLSTTLDQKKIVQLGESIHMTHEQPLARIGLIRFLKEKKNFDVLAFEGSILDFWVAMDIFLRSEKSQKDITRFRKMAFFGLWQTEEIEQVLSSALLPPPTEKPIYVTSFDIQPGIGFGFRKLNPFFEFGKRLQLYNSMISDKALKRVAMSLAPLQGCAQNGFPKTAAAKRSALNALSILEDWILQTRLIIRKEFPNTPHAQALSVVGFSLRQTIELCDAHQKNTDKQNKWAVYQPKRDELSAGVVTQIYHHISRHNRLMTWAHHSHVNYNSLNKVRVTLGQELKNLFGTAVYTIGVFARKGTALVGQEEPELKELRPIQDSEVDTYLSSLSPRSFFADLSGSAEKGDALLNQPATIQVEGIYLWKTQLAKDYDAIIYLESVSPPKIDFSPM